MIARKVVEMRPRASRHCSEWARDSFLASWSRGLLLPFFILMTPFLIFLDHNSYCVACRETFVSLALISTIALLCSLLRMPDGRMLNRELVKAGFAWWYRKYAPDDETLAQLEREARGARRGLWADPHAVPPWSGSSNRTLGTDQ